MKVAIVCLAIVGHCLGSNFEQTASGARLAWTSSSSSGRSAKASANGNSEMSQTEWLTFGQQHGWMSNVCDRCTKREFDSVVTGGNRQTTTRTETRQTQGGNGGVHVQLGNDGRRELVRLESERVLRETRQPSTGGTRIVTTEKRQTEGGNGGVKIQLQQETGEKKKCNKGQKTTTTTTQTQQTGGQVVQLKPVQSQTRVQTTQTRQHKSNAVDELQVVPERQLQNRVVTKETRQTHGTTGGRVEVVRPVQQGSKTVTTTETRHTTQGGQVKVQPKQERQVSKVTEKQEIHTGTDDAKVRTRPSFQINSQTGDSVRTPTQAARQVVTTETRQTGGQVQVKPVQSQTRVQTTETRHTQQGGTGGNIKLAVERGEGGQKRQIFTQETRQTQGTTGGRVEIVRPVQQGSQTVTTTQTRHTTQGGQVQVKPAVQGRVVTETREINTGGNGINIELGRRLRQVQSGRTELRTTESRQVQGGDGVIEVKLRGGNGGQSQAGETRVVTTETRETQGSTGGDLKLAVERGDRRQGRVVTKETRQTLGTTGGRVEVVRPVQQGSQTVVTTETRETQGGKVRVQPVQQGGATWTETRETQTNQGGSGGNTVVLQLGGQRDCVQSGQTVVETQTTQTGGGGLQLAVDATVPTQQSGRTVTTKTETRESRDSGIRLQGGQNGGGESRVEWETESVGTRPARGGQRVVTEVTEVTTESGGNGGESWTWESSSDETKQGLTKFRIFLVDNRGQIQGFVEANDFDGLAQFLQVNEQQTGLRGLDWSALFRASRKQAGGSGSGGGALGQWFSRFSQGGGSEGSFDFFGLVSIFRMYASLLQGVGGFMNNILGFGRSGIGSIIRIPGQMMAGVGNAVGGVLGRGRGGLGGGLGASGRGGLGGSAGAGGGLAGGNRGFSFSVGAL